MTEIATAIERLEERYICRTQRPRGMSASLGLGFKKGASRSALQPRPAEGLCADLAAKVEVVPPI